MGSQRLTTTVQVVAADVPTMTEMSDAEYVQYVNNELFIVDHHDVLISGVAGFPCACTRRQLEILIAQLGTLAPLMRDE